MLAAAALVGLDEAKQTVARDNRHAQLLAKGQSHFRHSITYSNNCRHQRFASIRFLYRSIDRRDEHHYAQGERCDECR